MEKGTKNSRKTRYEVQQAKKPCPPSICDKRWPDKSCLKCKKVDIFQQQKVRRFDVFCFLFLILDFKK